ncbi:hypothetical protein D3C78_802500 [compost metagenome]
MASAAVGIEVIAAFSAPAVIAFDFKLRRGALAAAGVELLLVTGLATGRFGERQGIYAVGPISVVDHHQARTGLGGRRGGCCVTERGIGVGNCHGVFLLVKVAASNVDAHVAAAFAA